MKSLFNFYLEDEDKKKATEKLKRLNGEYSKGQLASLLRILIKLFINTPDNEVDVDLLEAIAAEYEYTKSLNRRSKL